MLVIFGPSASGKTEIGNELRNKYGIKKAITCTTRGKRIGEIDSIDYYFISKDEILKEFNDGLLVEMTHYNNNYYGTRKSEVSVDKHIILDPNGVSTFISLNNPNIVVCYVYASEQTRYRRMLNRGDSLEQSKSRIEHDRKIFNIGTIPSFDFKVVTDDISIIEAAEFVKTKYDEVLKKRNRNKKSNT